MGYRKALGYPKRSSSALFRGPVQRRAGEEQTAPDSAAVPLANPPLPPNRHVGSTARRLGPSSESARDTVAIVACTLDDPFVISIRIWEESERVDPSDVADELRLVFSRYDVRELLVSEHDWSWVMLELADEGLPVTKVPRSPQWLALQWQQFFDAIVERRLTHEDDPVLARHAANLGLISGSSGLRPDLDVDKHAPIAGILGAMIAYDGMSRIEPRRVPTIHVWKGDHDETARQH
jgi:hypothetical protein